MVASLEGNEEGNITILAWDETPSAPFGPDNMPLGHAPALMYQTWPAAEYRWEVGEGGVLTILRKGDEAIQQQWPPHAWLTVTGVG